MNTPLCDFVAAYAARKTMRLHMPGHKGKTFLGCEAQDITEINGADSLFEASSVIAESEANASTLFGCRTFYSTEGSSLSIRAMLFLACLYAKENGKKPLIWAGRNAHKAYVSAAVLLDIDTEWLLPATTTAYLSCPVTADMLANRLEVSQERPTAIYLTTPDYLGNMLDLASIARVCRKHGVLLLVDNAHGAYLKFLPGGLHPMDAGATMCCDSAHKTLPVLTGGGYLHIADDAPALFVKEAKRAMMLFASTSPSYLILQSLDRANAYLAAGYGETLTSFCRRADALKKALAEVGFVTVGDEKLKLTLSLATRGYTGREAATYLEGKNIVAEFSDDEFLVLMLSPHMTKRDMQELFDALCALPQKLPLKQNLPDFILPKKAMSMRDAAFSAAEILPLAACLGRVLSLADCACPPAVPIAVCGELLDEATLARMAAYGIESCRVVRLHERNEL